MCNTVF
jgi:hypothetical protein